MSEVEKRASGKRREELKKPPLDRSLTPAEYYVRDAVDMTRDLPMDWFANHDIDLPGDPRIFTPVALLLIQDSKFERNLARNLPRLLPQGSRHLEVGAACGFLAAHLARIRPDLTQVVQESAPHLLQTLNAIWARSGVTQGPRLRLVTDPMTPESLGALIGKADSLLLGDPALSPETLGAALAGQTLQRIFLTGRLLAEQAASLPAYEALFRSINLTERIALDPSTCFAFQREGAPTAG